MKSKSLPLKYKDLLAKFEEKDRPKIEELLAIIRKELEISDLWEQPELAFTNWILLISGINQQEEMEIAKTLFFWKGIFAKDSARVLCFQSLEHSKFKCCTSHFGSVNYPALMMSDSPEMESFIKIDAQLLFDLNKDGSLQRFLTTIHSSIENGATLLDIEKELKTERWWSRLKLVYDEVKGLMTFKIGANIT